jgi:hypothetical protein
LPHHREPGPFSHNAAAIFLPAVADAPAVARAPWLTSVPNTVPAPDNPVGHPGALGLPLCVSGLFAVRLLDVPRRFADVFDDSTDFCFCDDLFLLAQVGTALRRHVLALQPFAAQVSRASGTGSASTDRVMRFHDDFATHDAAAHYAVAQGIDWVNAATRMSSPICI